MFKVFRLARLILTCPATNATSERSFSAVRRAKMDLQSIMTQNTDALSLIDMANNFVSGSKHRLSIFGKFEETDNRKTEILVKSKSTQTSFNRF